jgi:lipopolysaccharide assembly outer membrane protein LptD (OstA)
LLITYAGLDEKSVYYLGNGAVSPVVVTYDCLTIYAEKVFLDKRTLHLHAEGNVVVEDGVLRRVAEQGDVTIENGKAIIRLP